MNTKANAIRVFLLLVFLIAFASEAFAARVSVTGRKEWVSGGTLFAQLTGNVVLEPYEKNPIIQLYFTDKSGRSLSTSIGSINSKGQWTVGMGDYQLYAYYARLSLTYGNTKRSYITKTYVWGVK